MTKIDNTSNFINSFNKLERFLRKKDDSVGFKNFNRLVSDLSMRDLVVAEYKNDLTELAELRNAIQHDEKNKTIANVTPFAVKLVKRIYKEIVKPTKILKVASKPVECFDAQDNLRDVIIFMEDRRITHVPIYSNGEFAGILSENSVFRWVAQSDNKTDSVGFKVSNLRKYLNIKRPNEYFLFIDPGVNVYEVKKWFESAIEGKRRLGAVFVTKDGGVNSEMLGVFTAWDLPRIRSIKFV